MSSSIRHESQYVLASGGREACEDSSEYEELGDTVVNRQKVTAWIRDNMPMYDYGSSFDMAVDCAHDLGLCELCEVNGDYTFIPEYIVDICETFIPEV